MNKDCSMQNDKLKDTKKIQYKEGVFLLSNPEDVQELIRSIKAGELTNRQERENWQGASYDDYASFSGRFQSIEERLQRQAYLITEGIQFINNELALVRKALEQK